MNLIIRLESSPHKRINALLVFLEALVFGTTLIAFNPQNGYHPLFRREEPSRGRVVGEEEEVTKRSSHSN